MLQESFTPRESDVLSLILEGYSSHGIAERLVLTPETVRWYIKQIYSKLGVHSRDEAVARAHELRRGQVAASLSAIHGDPSVDLGSSFIGREALVHRLINLVGGHEQRLVALTGPPGVGKTRLGKEILHRSRGNFEECFFVDLSAETTANRVAPKIAEVLGLLAASSSTVVGDLRLRLRGTSTLLILDNFEHVIDAAPLVAELCRTCPGLTLIVTSREALRISDELVVEVPCLDPPPADAPDYSVAALCRVESVAFFVQRAHAASPRFRLTPDNAGAVAKICTRLDGLPLALELAAARCRMLAPDELLERLESRFILLSRGARDGPARQATLRGAIQWSYDLLSEHERYLFDRLGVFRGGWTLEAAEAIGVVHPPVAHVLDALDGIVAKSLASCREDRSGHIRFSFLETIHEFAHERLAESRGADIIANAHARYFAALAEQVDAQLVMDQQLGWYYCLEDEQDNHRVALRFAEAAGDTELLMRLTGALGWYWFKQARVLEGRGWAELAVTLDHPDLPLPVRIDAYNAAGRLAYAQGEHARAREMHLEALTLSREAGDSLRHASSLLSLGLQTQALGDLPLAYEQSTEAKSIMVRIGHRPFQTLALNGMGILAYAMGWREKAIEHLRSGLALALELRQVSHQTYLYLNLGGCLIDDDPVHARELITLGLYCARAVGDPRMTADALGLLSSLSRKDGDQLAALALANEGLITARSVAYRSGIVYALAEIARAHSALGSTQQADSALQTADSCAAESDDSELREVVERARAELGLPKNHDIPPIQGGDNPG